MKLLNLFSIKKTNDPFGYLGIPRELIKLIISEIKSNPQACTEDVIPQGIGKFGLTETNPVPVHGIPSNEIYLSRLRRNNGERIRWRRLGHVTNEIIFSPVDKYEIFDMKGNTISYIYISPYHWKTSNKAPEGFKIIN